MAIIDDLGPPLLAGRTIDSFLPAGVEQHLFVALIASHPRPLSTNDLCTHIWPGQSPEARRLWPHVSRLRKRLADHVGGGVAIDRRHKGYALAEDVELESLRFLYDIDEARRASHPDDRIDRLRCATNRWRGRLLEGFDVESLDPGGAAHLNDRRSIACVDLSTLLIDRGDHDEAAELARGVLTRSTYDETALVALATALDRGGRSIEAKRALHSFRLRLVEDLGAEPGPIFRELERQLHAERSVPLMNADHRANWSADRSDWSIFS